MGAPREAPVRLLVNPEFSRLQGAGKGKRLAEAQAQSLAGDRVNTSGGVSNQGNLSPEDAIQPARWGHGASFHAARLCIP